MFNDSICCGHKTMVLYVGGIQCKEGSFEGVLAEVGKGGREGRESETNVGMETERKRWAASS